MHKSPQNKKIFLALLVLTILLPAIFPSPASSIEFETSIEENRQVAVLLPLSGPFADLGKTIKEGFELGFAQQAVTDHDNRKFKIQFLDSKGNPETVRALITLLDSEGETVFAAGTPLNTTAWTASLASEESGLPYLIVGADQDNLINDKSIFTFRLTQTRSAGNQTLSAFIDSQEPAIQSLGIIYSEYPCAIRQARRLRKFCATKNIDLAIWEVYRSNKSNFYDLLNLIKERQPQLLFLATDPADGDKLWQQGRRLELMPSLTITIPISCVPTTDKTVSPYHPDNQILYLTPWLAPTDHENFPLLKNHLQAQGFAAAEIILESLEKSPNLTSGEIVKTLETTTITTVYGQVNFSGPGLGHQNPLPWYLCSDNEEGTNQIIFPLPPEMIRSIENPIDP